MEPGHEDDDYYDGESGHQALWVNLSLADCISTTVPLLRTWLGIVADDLRCIVGVASPTPLPTFSRPLFSSSRSPPYFPMSPSSARPYSRGGTFPL